MKNVRGEPRRSLRHVQVPGPGGDAVLTGAPIRKRPADRRQAVRKMVRRVAEVQVGRAQNGQRFFYNIILNTVRFVVILRAMYYCVCMKMKF